MFRILIHAERRSCSFLIVSKRLIFLIYKYGSISFHPKSVKSQVHRPISQISCPVSHFQYSIHSSPSGTDSTFFLASSQSCSNIVVCCSEKCCLFLKMYCCTLSCFCHSFLGAPMLSYKSIESASLIVLSRY